MQSERVGDIPSGFDTLSCGLRQLCENDSRIEKIIVSRLPEITAGLSAYMDRIELHNPAWSLVGTCDRRELVIRHILDSLSPLGIISGLLPDDKAKIADVGSGAGLPGIPLAIALPQIEFTLIERSGRRANFLRDTLAATGLGNIIVEEGEMEKVKPGRFDVVAFRALKTLDSKILRKLSRLCCEKGILAAYKGRREKILTEMESLEKTLPGLAGRWKIIPCPVPMLDEERHLVTVNVPKLK